MHNPTVRTSERQSCGKAKAPSVKAQAPARIPEPTVIPASTPPTSAIFDSSLKSFPSKDDVLKKTWGIEILPQKAHVFAVNIPMDYTLIVDIYMMIHDTWPFYNMDQHGLYPLAI
jgi:hypothetical protein